jgi:hypothetical protein
MKINKNDPRLTAYILNELGSAERELIEKAMLLDPELRQEIVELKQTSVLFQKKTDVEAYRLDLQQRENIFSKFKSNWSIWAIGSGLVTASLALILFNRTDYKEVKYSKAPSELVYADKASSTGARLKQKEESKTLPQASAPAVAESDSFGGSAAQQSEAKTVPAYNMVLTPNDVIIAGLNECFEPYLSKYIKYNILIKLTWLVQNNKATQISITDISKSDFLKPELETCIKTAVEKQNWPTANQFEYRLNIISN